MFERFTGQARTAVIGAQEEARALGHGRIGTEHLLLAVMRQPDEPGAATLARLGVTVENCRAAVAALITREDDALGREDAEALEALGIDLAEIRRRAEERFGPGALDGPGRTGQDGRRRLPGLGRGRTRDRDPGARRHIPFAPRAKKALERSLREAQHLEDRHIGVQHLLLGLLRCEDRGSRALFARLGLEPEPVRELVLADRRTVA